MIIFVGDKPSARTDKDVAFKNAACGPRLSVWIEHLIGTDDFRLINQSHAGFDSFVVFALEQGATFIALGNAASKALAEMRVNHFKLPHPSGRNRMINNKALIAEKLSACKSWLKHRGAV